MLTDNTDSVSTDFLITDCVSGPSSTKVHRLTDEVARTGDMARGREVVYGYITYTVIGAGGGGGGHAWL